MKDIILKYWKFILVGVGIIIGVIVIYYGASYVYRNTYASEKYEYAKKYYLDQVLDENVLLTKKIKRNFSDGEINLSFKTKNLDEVYQFTLGSELNPSVVEFGITGKIESGNVQISIQNDNNEVIFNRAISGNDIKEISKVPTFSKSYKLIIDSNDAQNGNIKLDFKFN